MNKYLLLSTTADRFEMAKKAISTVKQYLPTWKLVVVLQEYSYDQLVEIQRVINDPTAEIFDLDKRNGMHIAKVTGLWHILRKQEKNFVVCSMDDDMEFIPETNLMPAVVKAMQPGVGFVSAGWVHHESKIPGHKIKDQFKNQIIVYTGGGMIFSRKIAEIIVNMPRENYFSDNTMWSLAAYLRGYENFRYQGSLTIHRVCRTGGRKAWVQEDKRVMPDPIYLTCKKGNPKFEKNNRNNFLIGTDEDVTTQAMLLHEDMKRLLNIKNLTHENIP